MQAPKLPIFLLILTFFSACRTLEKASLHGFHSGYYEVRTDSAAWERVYTHVTEERVEIYPLHGHRPVPAPSRRVNLATADSPLPGTLVFRKNSLDIDLTAILLKYRPARAGLPAQVTTDYNMALYAGWRRDQYRLSVHQDPLGNQSVRIRSRGYDLGVFLGPGATAIGPSVTRDRRAEEYSGLVIQAGVAGFIESNLASFGVALGMDYLLNSDRKDWIYQGRPWVGFVVGIALN